MNENNFYKTKLVTTLIYIITIPIISYLIITNFFTNIDSFTFKGYIYSYILGICSITFLSLIFDFLKLNKKFKNSELFSLIFIMIYIILFIKFIKHPLKSINLPKGLINLIGYFSKILLFSGCTIPLNFFLQEEKIYSNKILVLQTINKILLFIILSVCLYKLFDFKGFVLTIPLIELIHFITNIIYTHNIKEHSI